MKEKKKDRKKLEYKPPKLKFFGIIRKLTLGASPTEFESNGQVGMMV